MRFRLLTALAVVSATALPGAARAAEPGPDGAPSADSNSAAEGPKDRFGDPLPLPPEPARDQRTLHVEGGATAALALPFGSLEDRIGVPRGQGPGLQLAGDLGLGISRTVVVGLWGDYGLWSGGRCGGCSTTTYAGGLQLRYYVAQGLRLDPWVSIGAGYRTAELDTGTSTGTYAGMEWLRLHLGASWYVFDKLVVGPSFGFALGAYSERPDPSLFSGLRQRRNGEPGVNLRFDLGLRIGFDFPGR